MTRDLRRGVNIGSVHNGAVAKDGAGRRRAGPNPKRLRKKTSILEYWHDAIG